MVQQGSASLEKLTLWPNDGYLGSVHAIHNADVPGSSPGVATIFFKGLAQANPFLFWSADYKPTTNRLRPPLPIYGSHKKAPHLRGSTINVTAIREQAAAQSHVRSACHSPHKQLLTNTHSGDSSRTERTYQSNAPDESPYLRRYHAAHERYRSLSERRLSKRVLEQLERYQTPSETHRAIFPQDGWGAYHW